jgi:hypothetical protein
VVFLCGFLSEIWVLQLFLDTAQEPSLVSSKKEEDFFADCITDGDGGFISNEVSLFARVVCLYVKKLGFFYN